MDKAQFVKKAHKVFGDRFDYTSTNYSGARKKVTIRCRKHGEFQQTASYHLSGQVGCKKCNSSTKMLSNKEAISRSKLAHGDCYDYSQYSYKGESLKVTVICQHHGKFFIFPRHHWNGAGCRKCKGLKHLYPEIAKEFHEEKNLGINVELIGGRSRKKVWWKCKEGHEFKSVISNRTRASKPNNCPVCSGRIIDKTNNLKARFPEIYKQLHPTKNVNIDIESISPGSKIKLWWKCSVGHEYDQSLMSKTSAGRGCPVCARQRASIDENLLAEFPDIAKYWDYSKNKKKPYQYRSRSNVKVWWKCDEGHDYQRSIQQQVEAKELCPYCSGQLPSSQNNFEKDFPDIAKEWHPTKNKKRPKDYLSGTQFKAWWLCDKGHEYQAQIYSRSRNGTGCPYCSGRFASSKNNFAVKFPELLKEWDYKKNLTQPEDCTPKSGYKAWWICEKGHSYRASLGSRAGSKSKPGSGCPKCSRSSSAPEFRILTELRAIFPEVISRYILNKIEADIFIPNLKIGIEYDGAYFHSGKEERDKEKIKFFKTNNISLIRVREKPLKKISNLDVTVSNKQFLKADMNRILKIIGLLNPSSNSLVREYISAKEFINESLFKEYMSYFPSPIPEKSLLRTHPKICEHWDYKKNYPLTPENFSKGSEFKAWWGCPRGHSYEDKIYIRVNGKGNCPICVGQRLSEDNNLEYRYPEIAREWHPKKNGELMPNQVMPGSHQTVWWLCSENHSYEKAIYSKVEAGYLKGCGECAGHNKSKESIIKEAREIYGDKFNYSKLIFTGVKNKFIVTCPHHGDFQTSYTTFISKARERKKVFGCPKCAGRNKTTNEIINEAKAIHGDKYDYSLLNYEGAKKKFIIICKLHGSFEKTYHSHIKLKTGCPVCSTGEGYIRTNQNVVAHAKEVHGDKYDYSLLNYEGAKKKFTIICKVHGPFQKNFYDHLIKKSGCAKCGHLGRKRKPKLSNHEIIELAKKIHKHPYDYSKLSYKGVRKKFTVICPEHGEWDTSYQTFIKFKRGCKKCTGFELDGITYESMSDAARKYGIGIKKIDKRLRIGWTLKEAFEIEPRKEELKYELNGVMYKSISDAARIHGLKISVVHSKLARGEDKLKVFGLD